MSVDITPASGGLAQATGVSGHVELSLDGAQISHRHANGPFNENAGEGCKLYARFQSDRLM
jgi:hypothetical protein